MLYGYKAKLIMMIFKTFHHHWSKWFSCPIHLQPFMLYKGAHKLPNFFWGAKSAQGILPMCDN